MLLLILPYYLAAYALCDMLLIFAMSYAYTMPCHADAYDAATPSAPCRAVACAIRRYAMICR